MSSWVLGVGAGGGGVWCLLFCGRGGKSGSKSAQKRLLAEPGLHLELPVQLASRPPSPTRAVYAPPTPPSRVGARMPRFCFWSWFGLIFHTLATWPIASAKESALWRVLSRIRAG